MSFDGYVKYESNTSLAKSESLFIHYSWIEKQTVSVIVGNDINDMLRNLKYYINHLQINIG